MSESLKRVAECHGLSIPSDTFYGRAIHLEERLHSCQQWSDVHELIKGLRDSWDLVRATSSAPLIHLWQLCTCEQHNSRCILSDLYPTFDCLLKQSEKDVVLFASAFIEKSSEPYLMRPWAAVAESKYADDLLPRWISAANDQIDRGKRRDTCHWFDCIGRANPTWGAKLWPRLRENLERGSEELNGSLYVLQILARVGIEDCNRWVANYVRSFHPEQALSCYQACHRINAHKAFRIYWDGHLVPPIHFAHWILACINHNDVETFRWLWPRLTALDREEVANECFVLGLVEEEILRACAPFMKHLRFITMITNYRNFSDDTMRFLLSSRALNSSMVNHIWSCRSTNLERFEQLSKFLPLYTFECMQKSFKLLFRPAMTHLSKTLQTTPIFDLSDGSISQGHPLLVLFVLRLKFATVTPDQLRQVAVKVNSPCEIPSVYIPVKFQWKDTLRLLVRESKTIHPETLSLVMHYAQEFGCSARGAVHHSRMDFPLMHDD